MGKSHVAAIGIMQPKFPRSNEELLTGSWKSTIYISRHYSSWTPGVFYTYMLQVGYQEARNVATASDASSIFDSEIYLLGCGKYIVTVSGYVFGKYVQ
jgi:hypothetical protein